MKTQLNQEDIEAITQRLMEVMGPLFNKHVGNTGDILYDINALSEYLKVSKKWIYERTHLKEIPHIKLDGKLLFRKTEIDKWLNAYKIPMTTAR